MTTADIISSFKKQPLGFVCGLLTIVLAVLVYLQGSTTEAAQTEFEAKSGEAAKIIANVNASKNLAEQLQEEQSLVKELESRLIKASQLAINLQYFYKLEAETNVKLLDVRPNAAVSRGSGATYTGVSFNVSVQGPYKQVMFFLNRLENGRHFCHFSSASFSKVTGDTSSPNVMTLTLNLELLGQP